MKFDSLKEKCEYYRSLTDYRLLPGAYTIAMLDGRAFSKRIKNEFELPFDDKFIRAMNETALSLCRAGAGVKAAFVQSDEISLVITDFEEDGKPVDPFFKYRIEKMTSVLASIATGTFNKELLNIEVAKAGEGDIYKVLMDFEPVQFDCRVWTVPNFNDMTAWFLYRQLDCIRNSKQQTAQQYFKHKELENLTTDDQIQKLKDTGKCDWWHDFDDGKKFGRFIYRETEVLHNEERDLDYTRAPWVVHHAKPWSDSENRKIFDEIGIPK